MKTVIRILIIAAALSLLLGLLSSITDQILLKGSPRGFFDLSIALSLLSIALSTGNPFGKAES